jgi:hypothetical protein
MPVTANFSEKFHERLGHDLTEELANHMNFIDQTYRTELRELNELNFARFDAKIEQRAMQLDAKWDERFREMDAKWEQRSREMDAKWDERFAKIDRRFSKLDAQWDKRFTKLSAEIQSGFDHARSERDRIAGELRGEMASGLASHKADLMKWMFMFWVGTTVTLVGTIIAVAKL